MCIYSFYDKHKLYEKISCIKNKNNLYDILEIIENNNDNINKNISRDNNGVLMFFHNLTNDTYKKLDLYIKNNIKKKEQPQNNISENDRLTKFFKNNSQINDEQKLSNKEKSILKRKNYEEKLYSERENSDKKSSEKY